MLIFFVEETLLIYFLQCRLTRPLCGLWIWSRSRKILLVIRARHPSIVEGYSGVVFSDASCSSVVVLDSFLTRLWGMWKIWLDWMRPSPCVPKLRRRLRVWRWGFLSLIKKLLIVGEACRSRSWLVGRNRLECDVFLEGYFDKECASSLRSSFFGSFPYKLVLLYSGDYEEALWSSDISPRHIPQESTPLTRVVRD